MEEIAIIELVQYETETTTYKPSHAGIRTPLETVVDIEKHYRLKFSPNCNYNFPEWVKEKWGHYEFLMEAQEVEDMRFYPRCSDNNVLPEGYDCFCEVITHYLLEKGFKLHSIGNILHLFTKEVE